MWLIGVIVGLWMGSLAGSFPVALFLAVVGGIGAHTLLKSNKNKAASLPATDGGASKPFNPSEPPQLAEDPDQGGQLSEIAALKRQVEKLNDRVHALERQVGVSWADTSPPEVQARPTPVSQRSVAAPINPQPAPSSLLTAAITAAASKPVSAQMPEAALASAMTAAPEQAAASAPAPTPATIAPKPLTEAGADDELWPKFQGPRQPSPAAATAARAPARPPAPPSVPFKDRLPEPIKALIFGSNTIVKLGVLILFLGLAFLLRYTAERVTVPVELRYAGVALVGVALLALGWFLRNKRKDYALILQGAGIGVFYLTILAAMKMHALVPPTAGFTLLFAVAVLGAVLAVLQDAPLLATVAVLEGFAAPVLASTGQNRPLGLFTYLAVLNVGVFLMAWFKAWRVLNVIAFVGTFTLASGWAQRYYTQEQYNIAQPFLVFFFLLFSVIGLLFARRTLMDAQLNARQGLLDRAGAALRQVGRVDSALVFGVPLTAFGLQYQLSKPWENGPAFAALAFSAFYLLMARMVFSPQRMGLALLAEAYAVVGVIFLTLAIPLGLEGQWTGAAWAIEAAGMYWLGVRQQRPYARGFAFVVLAGAAFKLLQATQLGGVNSVTVLHGTTIGPVLLALSVFAVWAMHRRADEDSVMQWEALPAMVLPWLGMAALTMLPWQWFAPIWAAAATAGMALAAFVVAVRWAIPALRPIVGAMQALAVAGLVANLQVAAPGAQAALSNGVQGMLSAGLIALSVLGTAGWSMAAARRAAISASKPPDWSLANAVAVVVGVSLLHLAMLFGASLAQASLIWPVSALAVLGVALRMSHTPLAALAIGLQVVSAALFVSTNPWANNALPGFAHKGFFTPLVLALAGLLAGDWVRAQAQRLADAADKPSAQSLWLNPWCGLSPALWAPVLWGLGWWLFAWLGESTRVLQVAGQTQNVLAASVLIVLLTSVAMVLAARTRNWAQMGQATLATLPVWIGLAVFGLARQPGSGFYVPSANWGWLVWPAALAWHLGLLRAQTDWLFEAMRKRLHIVGFWFFLLLAARECQWRFSGVGDVSSTWHLLGWVLVPALVLWLLCSSALARRWPLTEFRATYLQVACAPVALYLLAWVWVSNMLSPGNAAPLPYVPVLNPLELAHWLVLVALVVWWRALPEGAIPALSAKNVAAIAAATALALVTGMVLRVCHHWAGVAWTPHALYASWLVQAALSITWGLCGVAVMVLAHRSAQRVVWVAGAALLGVVVLKLFFVELANQGGLFRIVSFIAVGALLLLVGYFAPVPPRAPELKASV
jgi:uncharacterized membrane protein